MTKLDTVEDGCWNNLIYPSEDELKTVSVILGVELPILTIPVMPGRNLAVIIEVAAMNNRHKKYGYNAAQKLAEELERHAQGM